MEIGHLEIMLLESEKIDRAFILQSLVFSLIILVNGNM